MRYPISQMTNQFQFWGAIKVVVTRQSITDLDERAGKPYPLKFICKRGVSCLFEPVAEMELMRFPVLSRDDPDGYNLSW